MTAVVLFLAVSTLLCVGTDAVAEPLHQDDPLIAVVYDRKSDKTTVGLLPVKISGPKDKYQSLHMAPSFSYAGPTPQRPANIEFELQSVVRGRLDTDLYVHFIVDGEKIFLNSNRSALKRPVPGRVWTGERLVFRMPYEIFVKLANAKSAEIRFDAVTFPMKEEYQQALRDLLKYMNPRD